MRLTLTCWNYDRVAALLDGRINLPGIELNCEVQYPTQIFANAFTKAPYDISELSASSYVMQIARGNCPYIAVPAFISRAFRHGGIYVRSDRGIISPKSLEGRHVGVPEYQMTMAVWARGLLSDEFSVNTDQIIYRTGGTNEFGRRERLPLELPDHLDVKTIGPGRSLNDLILKGDIDAIISPSPPLAFINNNSLVTRLFTDPKVAEQDYFNRTGIFPIMHLIGIRREIADANPGLARTIYDGFCSARDIAMNELFETATASANRIQLPWIANEWEETRSLMGENFWPYGISKNRAALDALCRYSFEQHLAPYKVTLENLFSRETLE